MLADWIYKAGGEPPFKALKKADLLEVTSEKWKTDSSNSSKHYFLF